MSISGKNIVITGATSGIGAAFARVYAARGARLLLTGRRIDALEQRRAELLGLGAESVELVTGDLAREAVASELVRLVSAREPSALINNAGFGHYAFVGDGDLQPLAAMLRVHAELPLRLCHAALPGMTRRREGVIVNVGSLAGRVPVPGSSVYVATKVYLERLSETLAIEAARENVVVQALTPGYVRTDFHRDVEDLEARRKNRGLIRWMNADEVVAVSMRASERARRRLQKHPSAPPRRRDVVVVPGLANRLLASIAPLVPRTLLYRATAARAPR